MVIKRVLWIVWFLFCGFVGGKELLPDSDLPWQASETLLASVVIMRHGDRAAQSTAPAYAAGDRSSYNAKFPFDNYTWPVDYGQLSGIGEQQTRDFGRYLRKRYVGKFLSKMYNHYETHVRCTDVDRTLVSAMGVMAGLYPGENSIQDGVKGTVLVPVHTIPYATDALMDGSASAHCPKFNKAWKAAFEKKSLKNNILRRKEVLAALPALANISAENIAKMETQQLVSLITSLRDLRLCQRAHQMYQPENITRHDPDLEEITDMITRTRWESTKMGSLVGGRLLRAVGNRFKSVVAVEEREQWALDKLHEECNAKGSDSDEDGGCPRKLAVYTGHDTTIFDMRAALGTEITVSGIVPYVSHIILELEYVNIPKTTDRKGNRTMKVLAGSYLEEAKPLKGAFCGGKSHCSLESFLKYIERTVPKDIDAACGVTPSTMKVAVAGGIEKDDDKDGDTGERDFFGWWIILMLAGVIVGAVSAMVLIERGSKYVQIKDDDCGSVRLQLLPTLTSSWLSLRNYKAL